MIYETIRSVLKLIMISLVVGHWFGLHDLEASYLWAVIVIYVAYTILDD